MSTDQHTTIQLANARNRIAVVGAELSRQRMIEGEILRQRRGIPNRPDDALTASDLREIDARHLTVATTIRRLETEAAELQGIIGTFNTQEAARHRAEASVKHASDTAHARVLAAKRVDIATKIDVVLADLARVVAHYNDVGSELAGLEYVTGISGAQLAREQAMRGAVIAVGNAPLAKAFGAAAFADGTTPLADSQRDLLARMLTPVAIAAE